MVSHALSSPELTNTDDLSPSLAFSKDCDEMHRSTSDDSLNEVAVVYASVQFSTNEEEVETPPFAASARLVPLESNTCTSEMYMYPTPAWVIVMLVALARVVSGGA